MRPGRKLTDEEAELWARVASTVTPIGDVRPPRTAVSVPPPPKATGKPSGTVRQLVRPAPAAVPPPPVSRPSRSLEAHGLDTRWDRKLSRGAVQPDFTLDLHGASLDAAHSRLLHGLAQAKAMGARVVLLIAGKPRAVDAADRGQRRGAIRAKVIDWLAHSEHALDIAAIRGAHRRHGGPGALYIILKRRK